MFAELCSSSTASREGIYTRAKYLGFFYFFIFWYFLRWNRWDKMQDIYQRIAVRQYWKPLVTSPASRRRCWGHLLIYTSWLIVWLGFDRWSSDQSMDCFTSQKSKYHWTKKYKKRVVNIVHKADTSKRSLDCLIIVVRAYNHPRGSCASKQWMNYLTNPILEFIHYPLGGSIW